MLIFGIVSVTKSGDSKDGGQLEELDLKTLTMLIVVTGGVSVAISLIGLLGFFKRIEFLQKLYALLIFMLIILEMSMGILLLNAKVDDSQTFLEVMEDNLNEAQRGDLYNYFGCCWVDASVGPDLPAFPSCPSEIIQGRNPNDPNSGFPYCRPVIEKWLDDNMAPAAAAAIAVGTIEIVGLVAACIIVFGAEREDSDVDDAFHY